MSRQRSETIPIAEVCLRLHNRRIRAQLLRCGDIVFKFRTADTGTRLYRDQSIRLSPEAVEAMYAAVIRFDRGPIAQPASEWPPKQY
jgi:hypothetical protein